MKAFKEKRNTFHALLGMGIVILCVFALALAACGDSNTGTVTNPGPGVVVPVNPTPAPGGNTEENGGGNGGQQNPSVPPYVTGFYITAFPPLFDDTFTAPDDTEVAGIGEYFDAVIGDSTNFTDDLERYTHLAGFLATFPIYYEGEAPDLSKSGLKVMVTYSDGTEKAGNLSDFGTKPAVLGEGDISKEYDYDNIVEADLKRSIQVYHKQLEGFSRSVFIPVVIPIDRDETHAATGWEDVAKAGASVASLLEDAEAPSLTGASVFVKYPKTFQVSEYDDAGSGSGTAISLTLPVDDEGFKEVKLTEGHVFGDYYDGFGTAAAKPKYTRNGIDGDSVWVLVSPAGPTGKHGTTDNTTVFTKVGISKQVYIRQVEINKPLEWKIENDTFTDEFYLQGQAAPTSAALVADLITAGIELKVTYNDGTYSIRDTDYVSRAIELKNAGIPPNTTVAKHFQPYEPGNDRNADKFIEDWDAGILGYFTFAYYSSLLPTYQRRIGQEGDYSNFVFGYNQVDIRPRIPVATYVVGSGKLKLKETYSEVSFVGRYDARPPTPDVTVADTGDQYGMTNSEYIRIAQAYQFVGDYLFGTTSVPERELIKFSTTSFLQKNWFNRGRDPFQNRSTEEQFDMRPVPFAVPKNDYTNANYLLFVGEGQEDFEVKTFSYYYADNRQP